MYSFVQSGTGGVFVAGRNRSRKVECMAFNVDWFRYMRCPCGKGTYKIIHETDDWGKTRESWEMLCVDCKDKYVAEPIPNPAPGTPNFKWVPKDGQAEGPKTS